MPPETPPTNRRLISTSANPHSSYAQWEPLTVVEDDATAQAVIGLIERSGARAKMTVVPVWPNLVKVED